MAENNGNVQAAIDAVLTLDEAEEISEERLATTGLLVVAKGKQVLDLREHQERRLEKPRRIEGVATHTTLDSFVDHVNRFKDDRSAIFADDTPKKPRLTAVYDYHEKHGAPRFGKHRSIYNFPLSDQWLAWSALAEAGYIEQAKLALFLEDHVGDVLPPDDVHEKTAKRAREAGMELGGPSTLVQLARNLSVHVSSELTSVQSLATGEANLIYRESHATTSENKTVKVPSAFVLSVPVFREGIHEEVLVRLRYRAGGGKVVFAIVLHDIDALFRRAFREACERASVATRFGTAEDAPRLSLFFGSPE